MGPPSLVQLWIGFPWALDPVCVCLCVSGQGPLCWYHILKGIRFGKMDFISIMKKWLVLCREVLDRNLSRPVHRFVPCVCVFFRGAVYLIIK